jgi:hypothetical protein
LCSKKLSESLHSGPVWKTFLTLPPATEPWIFSKRCGSEKGRGFEKFF